MIQHQTIGLAMRLGFLLLMAGLFTACSDSENAVRSPDLPPGELQSIAVDCDPGVLSLGQMGQCTAIGQFRQVTETSPDVFEVTVTNVDISEHVEWRSQKPNIVSVNANGKITGESEGSSDIIASFDGISGSETVSVVVAELQSIQVQCNPDVILVGNQSVCTASGLFDDGNAEPFSKDITEQVNWTSSNNGIASVNDDGIVTGVDAGPATITANLGSISGADEVTVRELAVVSLAVQPAAATAPPLCSQAFQAIATFEDGSSENVTASTRTVWSSDSAATTVDGNGLATAGAQGTADAGITASYTDTSDNTVSDTAILTVEDTAIDQLCVEATENGDPDSSTCNVVADFTKPIGISVPFSAKLIYDNGSVCALAPDDPRLDWRSTDAFVASVNNEGVASTLANGPTNIEATMAAADLTGSHPLMVGRDLLLQYEVLPDFACVGFFTGTADNVPAAPPPSPGTEQMKAEGVFQIAGPTCDFADPDGCTNALNADTDWKAVEGFWDGAQCSKALPSEQAPAGDFTPPATVDSDGLVTTTGQIRIGTACIVGTHLPTGQSDAGTVVVFPVADDAQMEAAGEICDSFEPLFQAGGEDGGAGAMTQLISALGQLLNPLFLTPPLP